MKDLERTLYSTDFSKHTDLKGRLAAKLFGTSTAQTTKVVSFPFQMISDEDAELVNAAQGIFSADDDKDRFPRH